MARRPGPGTFRLYNFANPPLTAGPYTLTGEVTGLPGSVETLHAAIDVTAPRFALPPDQVLSTFPPASARGAFTSRLPQVVIRRRTVPWERSAFTADGVPLGSLTPAERRSETPRPWLALVLIADGEGSLVNDVPVNDCTTSGTTLPIPSDTDVARATCLEVPEGVVAAVFPALEDLPSLVHVREVDLEDTELAMGDDDGWMAVVLCNRLPQAGTGYTACLVNLEGQYDELPVDPPVAEVYDPRVSPVDLEALGAVMAQYATSADAPVMGTTTFSSHLLDDPDARAASGALVDDGSPTRTTVARGAAGGDVIARAAVGTVAGWSSSISTETAAGAGLAASSRTAAAIGPEALGSGLSVYLPWHLIERTLRFPVLLSWSFFCTDAGDFQYLAQNVNARLLGHLPTGPETPDGVPLPPGTVPPGLPAEPPSARPLPLVTATGHVATAHETRIGASGTAWFRGPLVPTPVDRPGPRTDDVERYPLAHHADQVRRVSPDGREDLSYAAAFEIGRLLALSRPSVVAALNQWRRQRFAAATTAALGEHLATLAPQVLGDLFLRTDPLVDRAWATEGLPGPPVPEDPRLAAGVGRRFVRGLLSALGDAPEEVAPVRPLADPGFAVDDAGMFTEGRDQRLAAGLGLAEDVLRSGGDASDAVADRLWATSVATAPRDAEADHAAARAQLESLAGDLLAETGELIRRIREDPR